MISTDYVKYSFEMLLSGSLLMIGVNNISIYFVLRRDLSYIIHGISCLLVCPFVLITGGIYSYIPAIVLLFLLYPLLKGFISSSRYEALSSRNLKRDSIEMEEINSQLSVVLHNLDSALIVVDEKLEIIRVNKAAGRFLFTEGLDAEGKKITELIELRPEYAQLLSNAVKSGNPVIIKSEQVILNDERLFNVSINPAVVDDALYSVIVADDITEQLTEEEMMKHAHKMETIGTIAGGLSYDFNNALSGIMSASSLLEYSINNNFETEKIPQRVQLIEKAAHKAEDLVSRFLNLTRIHDVSYAVADLNEIIQHVVKMCKDILDKGIEIKTGYIMDEALIFADAVQIEHIILNLCINAAQSIAEKRMKFGVSAGVLDISICDSRDDYDFMEKRDKSEKQDYWFVKVSDTGTGISTENLAKIFEPFFSTKESGTGLGLAIASSIIKQHGGFIDVASEPGKGSSFSVYFKQHKGISQIVEKVSLDKKNAKGEGIILVVEDDDIIREMACDILTENGYEIIKAENGEEALDLFRQNYHRIKGVFMDNSMPVMSGAEAFAAMKEFHPDVKVILTSGIASDPNIKNAINGGVDGFIRKPYSMSELLIKTKEVFG